MSDPVLDALAARAGSSRPPPTSGDPVMDALTARALGKTSTSETQPHEYRYSGEDLNDEGVGAAEAGLHAVSSMAGTAVGGVHAVGDLLMGRGVDAATQDIDWWKRKLTYDPRTSAGQGAVDVGAGTLARAGAPLQALKEFSGDSAEAAGWGPLASTAMSIAPDALLSIAGAPGVPKGASALADMRAVADATGVSKIAAKAAPTVDRILYGPSAPPGTPVDPLAGFGADSASAAAASRINAAKSISPELLTDLRAQVQKGPLTPEAVDRQIDADALPVRMRLMEGQASKDPETWSREFNAKGKDTEVAARFNEQNQQLIDNLDEFRRQAAPQAVAHDPVQSGQNIIDAYKRLDDAASEEIGAAYKAARDANGGDLPMDAHAFVGSLDKAKNAKTKFLPSEISEELAQWREGAPMSFEQFEDFRTTLANAARKAERASDGNAVHAIGVVRDALEDMSMAGTPAAAVKDLYDKARALARARFDRMNPKRATYDPAYKAAVDDPVSAGEASPLADKFVQQRIVGAPRAHIGRMMETLSGDDLAMETIRAAPFNYMKQKAGIDPYRNEGNFSQAGYNRALTEVSPKLDMMVGDDLAEQARRLGRVAYDVKGEPAGSFPNRSNTFIAATAEAAKGLAERSANTLIGGNIVPVGTWAREKLNARTAARESRERLRPAAGVVAKPKSDKP